MIIEHEKYIDFYYIPNNTDIVINKSGVIRSLLTGNILKSSIKNHGYLVVDTAYNDGISKIRRTHLVHRCLALVFIDKPNHLKDIPFDQLQVNHKDGNKLNIALDNLEWVTQQENMQHAFANKIISIGIEILAKDVRTNEIIKFNSIRECSDHFNISTSSLRRHLLSIHVGKLTKDWCVFKYNDGSEWPILHDFNIVENKFDFTSLVIAKDLNTNAKFIFNTLKDAADILKLNYMSLQKYKANNENVRKYKNWLFKETNNISEINTLDLKPSGYLKRRENNCLYRVINTSTGETHMLKGNRKVSELIKYSRVHIYNRLSIGKNDFGIYNVYKVNMSEITLPRV